MHKYREEGIGSGYNLGFTVYASWGDGITTTYDFSSEQVSLSHSRQFEELEISGPIIGLNIAYGHVIDTMKVWSCEEIGPESEEIYIDLMKK